MEPDFSGYATKTGLKCSDGRTIMPDAFKDMDTKKVPLVWSHGHSDPQNVLGHAVLEDRADGTYAYAFFNSTAKAQDAKIQVEHGDITQLSIFANKLVERAGEVHHGIIREVSLVMAGANPGAVIDNITISHGYDGDIEIVPDAAVIYTEEEIELEHADEGATVEDILNTMNDEQRDVVNYLVGVAAEGVEHAELVDETDSKAVFDSMTDAQKAVTHTMIETALDAAKLDASNNLQHTEGSEMTRNVFEQQAIKDGKPLGSLSHDDMKSIAADAVQNGSFKKALEGYALQHGIENIEALFPDFKSISDRPEFNQRRVEWVTGVMNGVARTPFSRIKTLSADLTYEAARAKGYIKGRLKKEEFFGISKRITGPTTVYKKQKLDRDDVVDIVDFDVIAWMKVEMRMMLMEELARAILIGDGRAVDDEDKIKDPYANADGLGIRSIANEHELYATTILLNIDDAGSNNNEITDAIVASFVNYKGSGTPTLYTTQAIITKLLLTRDTIGRRLYRNIGELASELGVSTIVPVEVMEDEDDLIGIMVNLADYTVGNDRGGEVTMFDDFDIDYNQLKYLIETRLSGALKKIKSAVIFRKTAAANVEVEPLVPSFVQATNTITIPTKAGVTYKIGGVTKAAGPVVITADTVVNAVANAGYYIENSNDDNWTYKFKAV